jgi:hypothetical protein
MLEFARVFLNIALLRRGPQDLPASKFLLAALIALAILVNLAVSLVSGFDVWLTVERSMLSASLGLLLTAAVLSIAGRRHRFVQASTAMVGAELVIAPLAIVLLALAKPYGGFASQPDWLRFFDDAYEAWDIIIVGHVYRAALERNFFLCVLLAFACEIIVVTAVEGLFPMSL